MFLGFERAPRSLAGRVLVAFWFIFTVFTLVLYTASMISIVSSAQPEMNVSPAEDLDALVESGEYTFSAVHGGTTYSFLKASNIPVYEKIFEQIESVDSVASGVEKARQGKNAFVGENILLNNYIGQEPCDLTPVGASLSANAYAIATQKGSEHKDKLSQALLELQENGDLQVIYKKWFEDNVCPEVSVAPPGAETHTTSGTVIDEYRFAGAVIILIIGLVLACIVGLAEFLLHRKKNAVSCAYYLYTPGLRF